MAKRRSYGALAWGRDDTVELNATINERRCWKGFEEVCSFNDERKCKCCYQSANREYEKRKLPLNNETLNPLRLKHLDPKDAYESVMLSDVPERIHPVKFEVIDAEMIRKAAMKTRGGSDPSGLDADGWK